MSIVLILLYGVFGAVMAGSGLHWNTSWQFWALLVTLVAVQVLTAIKMIERMK